VQPNAQYPSPRYPQQNTNYPSNQAYGAGQPSQAQAAGFADPQAMGGSPVKVRHLEGRHVVIVPVGYNPTAKGMNPTDPPRPTITADVLVLDGGEMQFGDNLSNRTPCTLKVQTPYYATGLLIGNSEIVRALVGSVGKEIVLGRVVKGTQGNCPFLIERLDPSDPIRELAARVWTSRVQGQFVNPSPEPIMPQQQYGPPPQAQYPPQVPQGYGYPPGTPQMPYGQPSQAPSAYVPQAAPPLQQVYAQAQSQPAPAAAGIPCPPGWNPETWAGLPEAQRQQIAAAQAQQYGQTAPAAGMAGPTGF
jgi:hypothetical protein